VQPYQRRSKSLDEVFPQLFLEGLATRDFEPALRSLLGAKATLSREHDWAVESAIQRRR
jgi:transposase-like protein